jgi:hypothetical protein
MTNPVTATTNDDGSRSYTYPPTGEQFPSVTTVLGATEGKPWLVPWSARLAAEYAVDHLDLIGAVADGRAFTLAAKEGGRKAAVDLAKRQAAQVRDRKRDTGGYVHDVVEALILWQASPEGRGSDLVLPVLPEHLKGADYDDEPVEDVADWMLTGFLNFVADFKPVFHAAEMTVFSAALRVAGTLDMIVTLPGLATGRAGRFVPGDGVTPCVDVKTGRHLDVTVPEQIAAYRRMTEALLPMGELVPMPRTKCGAVLHLRPEHPRGYRLMLISGADDAAAWNRFRRAVELHEGRLAARAKPGKVCYPLRDDGTVRQPLIADLDGEGYGRAISPLVKAGITDLEQLAAMDAGDCLKVKGVGGKVLDVIRAMLADHGLCLKGEELLGILQAVREHVRTAEAVA